VFDGWLAGCLVIPFTIIKGVFFFYYYFFFFLVRKRGFFFVFFFARKRSLCVEIVTIDQDVSGGVRELCQMGISSFNRIDRLCGPWH
jgi:hypothetical protein